MLLSKRYTIDPTIKECPVADRLRESYQKLMREPFYRARAANARAKKLEQRVYSLITAVLLFGLFGSGAVWELQGPDTFWFGVAAAVVALYSLAVFLIDWPALAIDLRAREALDAGSR
jgi:membrane protein YdbS with pleckstrin-like domain